MSLEQIKMAVPGIRTMGRTLVKMDAGVDGQGRVVNPMMVSLLSSDDKWAETEVGSKWEISGKRNSLTELVHIEGRHGMYLRVVMDRISLWTGRCGVATQASC